MTSARELQDQGVKLFDQHDYEAAARLFQQARDLYEQEGQKDMVAEMTVNIGLVHRALGENQQALDLMQEALRFFQEANDQRRAAQVMGNMGAVYMALGHKEDAYKAYRQAADTFKALDDTRLYSETLLALGMLQVRQGQWFEGAATYQVGLAGLDKLNGRQKIMKRLTNFILRLNNRAVSS